MKFTTHFIRTQKEAPSQVSSRNAELLIRAGFIHQEMAGVYSFLPLGLKVLNNIQQIVREEMDAAGCIEMSMPSLCGKENWEQTNRWEDFDVLYKIDTSHGEAALCPTHEEVITPLVKAYLRSYKDFPVCLYQFQTKFRNEPRAKSGLLRCREFLMKDGYSFHTSQEDFEQFYDKMKEVYHRVYARLGLGDITAIVKASGGAFSKYSHEYQTYHPVGEDLIYVDTVTGQSWNKEIATGTSDIKNTEEPKKTMSENPITRPNDIAGTADIYGCEPWRVLKNVVYMNAAGAFFMATIRGDLSVSQLLLEDLVGEPLFPASPEQLANAGFVQGFIAPINLTIPVTVYADESVKTVHNYNTGANKQGTDYVDVNIEDLQINTWGNFAVPTEHFLSPDGNPLALKPAVEVGNIFPLASKFSDAFSFQYIGDDGKSKPVIMGCYGIGVSRLMGVIAEVFADEKGLHWTKTTAPAQVHLMAFGRNDATYAKASEVYTHLIEKGIAVLFDDRREKKVGFGQKMADADLIGIPCRIVMTDKTLDAEQVEWSMRGGEPQRMSISDAIEKLI